jgi:hypothetical protein
MTILLKAARGSRNAPRWTVALALGLRRGEVPGLRWNDVVLPTSGTEGTITVRRQLQRVSWKHGCPDPGQCVNRAGSGIVGLGHGLDGPVELGHDPARRWHHQAACVGGADPPPVALGERRPDSRPRRCRARVTAGLEV